MEAKSKFDAPHAFILTSSQAKKLWDIFYSYNLIVYATVSCSDGMIRKFDSCENLMMFENSKRSEILSIEFSAKGNEPYMYSEISFGERYHLPISGYIHGEESKVSELRTKILDVIESTKAWYSWLSKFDLFYFWMPLFIISGIIFNLTNVTKSSSEALPLKAAILGLVILVSIVGIISLLIWGTSFLKKRFFPISAFSIGQGESRVHHLEQIRWVVIVGFIVGVVSSIVTTLAMSA